MLDNFKFWSDFLTYFQIITVVILFFFNKKFKDAPVLKYFVFALAIQVLVDFGAKYYHEITNNNNWIIYNCLIVFIFVYQYILYRVYIKSPLVKKVVLGLFVIYFTMFLCEIVVIRIDIFSSILTTSFLIGKIGVLFCVFYYFFEILKDNRIVKIDRSLMFWINISFFIDIIINSTMLISIFDINIKYSLAITLIRFLGLFIYYVILIIGFAWSKEA